MKHKLLSILLCLAMALSLLPTAALAEGEGATAAKGTSENPYTREEFAAMTRQQYIEAQNALNGTMYVKLDVYTYDKDGVLGNGTADNSDRDSTKLNYYGAPGAKSGQYSDAAVGKNIVFVGSFITSKVTGYESIDNIGTSLLLAVPAYTNVTFKDITFNGVMSFDYQLYTSPWSQLGELKFEGCTFDGSIIVGSIAAQTLTFNGCTFENYTNEKSANNSNPTWIRPAYGNWSKGDNEGQGDDFRSLTEINFTGNTVTSTRPVKFEYISQWDIRSKVTATNNYFDISAQANDEATKIKNVGLYLGAHTDANAFDLVVDNNTKSSNTAALYTIPEGQTSLPAGSTVKDSSGNDTKLTDALKWKGNPSNPDDVLTLKTECEAKIGDAYYATLAEAFDDAGNGDTVTLLKDVTENVTIPADKTITLDLNGKTINGKQVSGKPALTVNGSVTVKDSSETKTGTIKREDTAENSGKGSHYVIDIQGENASLTFESGNVTNGSGIVGVTGASLVRVGNDSNTAATPTLTINGGKFTQDNFIAIKVDYGTLNVTGGEINSANSYAIENWKDANVTGGTINGAVASWTYSSGANSTTTISGGTINGSVTSVNYGNAAGKKATVNVSGNAAVKGNLDTRSYDPKKNELTSITDSDKAAIAVSGGNFSQSVKKEYLDSSLNAELKKASGDTPYSYYTDVAAATAAAKPGDTVKDLSAATGEATVTVTLDYNGGGTNTTITVKKGSPITLPTPTRSGYTFNGWYAGSTFYAAGASYTVSATVTLTASWSYISSGSSGSSDPTYSVSTPSKTENGTVTVSPKSASKGDTVTITVKPDSGYVLETLTVTDKNGNELTLKDKGDGKYTFTMPAGRVEVKATFMEDNSMLNFFYDVPNDAYFYEAVKWAVKNGITDGVGNNLFAPEQPCTRAQIVTFLWRAAGSPEPKGTATAMTDVISGSYYEKAVAWAIENGVTTGTTATTFSPDATCTRAQAVTFLARALNAKASGVAEFTDVPVDSYFAEAVAWAAANGVTEGIGGGLFGSDNDCTRGQIVTFLYRAYNK